jgi:hypothetical protein
MSILTMAEREELGLPVDYEAEIRATDARIAAKLSAVPCGCYACNEQVQQGHFACEAPPEAVLRMERAGLLVRRLDGSRWVWVAV